MYFKLTNNGNSLVELVLEETGTVGRNRMVNSTALDLIRQLDMILEVRADFEPTDGFSTKVYNVESGKPLYNIESFRRRGEVFVGIYPLSSKAKSYLRDLASD